MAQFNVRLPKRTEDQVNFLTNKTGMTQTQLTIIAFDHLYQEYRQEEKEKEKEMEVRLVTVGGVPPNIKKFSEITSDVAKDLYWIKDENGTDWPMAFAVLNDPLTPEFPYRGYEIIDPISKIQYYKLSDFTRHDPFIKHPPLVQPPLNAIEVYALGGETKGKLPVTISLEEARNYIDKM